MSFLKIQNLNDIAVKSIDLNGNYFFYSKFKNFEGEITSPYYVINLPLNGEECYVVNDKKFKIDKSHYLLTKPGQKKISILRSKDYVESLSLCLSEDYLQKLYKDTAKNVDELLDFPVDKDNSDFILNHTYKIRNTPLSYFLLNVKNDFKNNALNTSFNKDMFFLELGSLLLNNQIKIQNKLSLLPNTRISTREEIYRRVDIMNQFIHDNFTESITLEELSQVAYLSKYHAVRCYKKIEGMSPYKKITMLRLEKAKELLNLGFSISEVSDLCGFTDYRAFSKLFKSFFGFLPSNYLKKETLTKDL